MTDSITNVRRTFVDGKYGQIHCRIAKPENARQAAIVCLHMSPKSSVAFRELLPHLADDRIAMAPDNPGHGESDLPPAEPHVRIPDYAQSAWDAIDALTDGPVHLLGYHTGSMVAVEAARQRPKDVLSIINIAAPIFTAAEEAELDQTYSPLPLDTEGSRFQIMWGRVMDHLGPGVPLQVAAASFAENLRAGDDYEWGHRAAFAWGQTYNKQLAELTHPFLIINPNDDCHEMSLRANDIIKNVNILEYPAVGHGFCSTEPEKLAATIKPFIAEHDTNV
jgi:pimeloyl-ACP methyl ester carboxylesterase